MSEAVAASPVASSVPADRLADAARRLRRLRPDWSNPARFFEERSEIEHELRNIEQEIR